MVFCKPPMSRAMPITPAAVHRCSCGLEFARVSGTTFDEHLWGCDEGNSFFLRHEKLVAVWAMILRQAGFSALTGEASPTYSSLFGPGSGMEGAQGKADIFVPDWVGGHGLFDVGITFVTRRSDSVCTAEPAAQANRMALQKSEDFSRRLSEGQCPEGAYQFVALCADAAGAWGAMLVPITSSESVPTASLLPEGDTL